MNRKIVAAEVILAFLIVMGFRYAIEPKPIANISRAEAYKNKLMTSCSPDWTVLDPDSLAATITPLTGWGNYSWKIRTISDSAQFYFNQGINMYYAFHIIESMASFKKAETFDPANPLIYWAQALAYGPNINDFAYAPSAEALVMAQKAKELSASLPEDEKALVDAMLVRYTSDTTISRTDLNTTYAKAMEEAFKLHGDNADVMALYADALMLLHPWEYWKHDGEPHPWTPRILEVIEKGLGIAPQHPGLNHYYIHTSEASPNPGRATASADRLGLLMPGVSHMVHMPSHIYIRTGEYQKGVTVNEMSVKGYYNYLGVFPEVKNNVGLYLIHNLHMQATCAMFRPAYAYSFKTALDCISSFDTSFLSLPQPMGNYIQYVYLTPQFVNVRYGKWNEILKEPEIPSNYAYAGVLSNWAKGMAYANKNDFRSATMRLTKMRNSMVEVPDLKIVMTPFNAAYDAALIAERILQGTIFEKMGENQKAIAVYKEAVIYEDALIYNEPKDWLIPSRHYLANVLIKIKDYPAAKSILLEDLNHNPANFYALYAMEQLLKKQGKTTEAREYGKKFQKVYRGSDLRGPSLIY